MSIFFMCMNASKTREQKEKEIGKRQESLIDLQVSWMYNPKAIILLRNHKQLLMQNATCRHHDDEQDALHDARVVSTYRIKISRKFKH